MRTSDLYSGRTVPLLIPEPIWREWRINGVDATTLAELKAEYGAVVGYEFDWGLVIEQVFDGGLAADAQDPAEPAGLAVRWNFVLRDLHAAFLDAGGNLGELSALAVMLLANIEQSRHELPPAARDGVLPHYVIFDEGNHISAFAVCVVGASNVPRARKWMANYFVPAVLPILVDRLRAENALAGASNARPAVQ